MKTLTFPCLLVLFLASSCLPDLPRNRGESSNLPKEVSSSKAAIVRTLVSGVDNEIALQTIPNALCEISAADNAGTSRVFSDDRGVVGFSLRPIMTEASELTVTCQDDTGSRVSDVIALRIGAADSEEIRQEAAERSVLEGLSHPGAIVLPSLTAETASSLTDDDLRSAGYPPRFGTDQTSPQYRRWLEIVGKPITVLSSQLLDNPGVSHAAASSCHVNTSSYWSGLVLDATAVTYGYVYGRFNVPTVTPQAGFNNKHALAFWVGLDGCGSNDVVQDGSWEDTVTQGKVQTSTYHTWVEYYPAPEKVVSLPIKPGNDLEVWSWVSDATGHTGSAMNIASGGGYGWYYLYNATTSKASGWIKIKKPNPSVPFKGNTAEWIMERPNESAGITTLANYGTATMTSMSAIDTKGVSHTYLTDPYQIFTMVDGANVLSTMSIDSGNLDFTWHLYQ